MNLSLKCSSAPYPSCNDSVPSPHDLSAPIAPSVSVTVSAYVYTNLYVGSDTLSLPAMVWGRGGEIYSLILY